MVINDCLKINEGLYLKNGIRKTPGESLRFRFSGSSIIAHKKLPFTTIFSHN